MIRLLLLLIAFALTLVLLVPEISSNQAHWLAIGLLGALTGLAAMLSAETLTRRLLSRPHFRASLLHNLAESDLDDVMKRLRLLTLFRDVDLEQAQPALTLALSDALADPQSENIEGLAVLVRGQEKRHDQRQENA